MLLTDLVFILLFLTAVGTLLTAGFFAAAKKFERSRRFLFRLFVGAALYMLSVVVVSLVLPRRILKPGDMQCFDDWCVSVVGSKTTETNRGVDYYVDLTLFSRARRVAQRENHLAVYLTDKNGRRFDPVPDKSDVPLDVQLQPGQSIILSRRFTLPPDATDVGAVITHEGGFPIGWFILGYDTWFRKPPLIRLA
jgi:hypothetical protein